jgi:F-type H+-transporting ATPase subunit delta
VYADAVWSLACKQKVEADFADEIESLARDVIMKNPRLEAFLNVGSIKQGQRQAVIDLVFKGHVSELLYRLLCNLNRHDRMGVLPAVATRIRQLAGQSKGHINVTVTSAISLSEQQKSQVENLVRQGLKGEPVLNMVVDESLLGGLKIAVGETVYDYSVRANLERLREGILTRSTHEIQS